MSILCYFCIHNSILFSRKKKLTKVTTVTLLVREDSKSPVEQTMQAIGKSWRDSASLIVVARRAAESAKVPRRDGVNYDILLQTRTRSASFPNSVVFPGGVSEPADAADNWLTHLGSFGYSKQDFESLHCPGTAITPIFQDNPIQRHISLRITAIRETFEELGLLLCSRDHKEQRIGDFASIVSDIDIKHWQQRVSKQPEELLSLCKEYSCYPDIWALHYWSNWLSPVRLPKRFSTAFFITALESKPDLKSNSEVIDVKWLSPLETLQNPDLVVYPPQVYELSRLSYVPDIEELIKFAKERSCHGQDLLYPVTLKAKDGNIHLLPGDELYPSSVDYNDKTIKSVNQSVKELRENSSIVHRFEISKVKQFVFKNYKPKNHINMGDSIIMTNAIVH